MNERERFEKWIMLEGYPINRSDEYPEFYGHPITQTRWYVWQAALQSQESLWKELACAITSWRSVRIPRVHDPVGEAFEQCAADLQSILDKEAE